MSHASNMYVVDLYNRADNDEPAMPLGWYFAVHPLAEFLPPPRWRSQDFDGYEEWFLRHLPHHVPEAQTAAFEAWWDERHYFIAAWIGGQRFQVWRPWRSNSGSGGWAYRAERFGKGRGRRVAAQLRARACPPRPRTPWPA